MLHALQNPSQAGEDGGKLFFLFSHPPFICAMLNGGISLNSSNGLEWYGRAVGMATLVSEQCSALQFL